MAALFYDSPAKALQLPTIVSIELPIQETPLADTVAPLLHHANTALPATITPGSTLGIQVALPTPALTDSPRPTAPILDVSVDTPIIPQVVTDLTTTPATPALPALPSLPTVPRPSLPTAPSVVGSPRASGTAPDAPHIVLASTPVPFRHLASDRQSGTTAAAFTLPSLGTASFFGRGLSADSMAASHRFFGKKPHVFPLLVSSGILLCILAILLGVVSLIDRRTLLANNKGRFAQFALTHDVTQLSVVAIMTVGAIAIIGILLLG